MYRISIDEISTLEKNDVFVFGSNLIGVHGAGAARLAYEKFGAVWGQGVGLQGQSYAIPTKDKHIQTMNLNDIMGYVQSFIFYASLNPGKKFLVTQIGCGLAGLTPEQVAPMFQDCLELENVYLPKNFIEIIINQEIEL